MCHSLQESLKMIHFNTKGHKFLKVHVLHNFTKYFSDTRVNKIVNNCPIFAICYIWVRRTPLFYRKMDDVGNC